MRSRKNLVILFLSLTTLTAAAVVWRQYREIVRLQVVALGTSERADWQKRLGATEKRRVELETQVAELPPKPLPSEENAEEPTPPATEPRMIRRNGPNNFMAMMDRPDVQRLVAVQQR